MRDLPAFLACALFTVVFCVALTPREPEPLYDLTRFDANGTVSNYYTDATDLRYSECAPLAEYNNANSNDGIIFSCDRNS